MKHIELIYGIAAVVCAALFAYVATPLVRVLAFRLGAIDVPKDERRMHTKPIPRMGGVAIYIAFTITTLAFGSYAPSLVAIWFGGTILVVLGMFDDIFNLNAWFKLGVQIIAALVAVLQGVVIDFVNIGGTLYPLGALAIPITVLWIVGLTNAINFIDGLDGLACGVSTICSASLTVVAILMSSSEAALLTAILAGSCLGFLPFNSHPAKIFMGDAGALFLGYTLSVLSVTGIFKTHAVLAFLIPMSVFGLPLFDTAFAVIRRLLHGQSPFHADRGHIHHRLIDMGFGHRRSVLTLYAICGILGIAAVMLTLPVLYPALIIIVCALALFLGTSFVMRHPETREQTALIDAEKASSAPVKTPEKSEKKEVVPQLEAKKKEV
ncbi:MAG: undecaprenyl/decaprenyl-phosphate alpha-N-acetylglucosaminyl 1-phosphate transferase [Clostridia bacterium]|nr:undecaprenyl/decaprenyl-phosphate alpha-N-acetylglucosaminyl 1-phosphate transferase [Clostridia bacterium]